MNAGQCPATRGRQTCASIGPHARHVWTDPEPVAELATEPDEALVEAVARAIYGHESAWQWPVLTDAERDDLLGEARAAIAAVRAYDAEHGDTAACPDPCDHGHSFDEHSPRHDGSVTCSRCGRRIHYDGTVCECSIGVPPCPGTVYREHVVGAEHRATVEPAGPCTLPLGHHGGCR